MHPLPDAPAARDRPTPALRVERMGFRSYADATVLQQRAAGRVMAGGPDELLFVDHPPVITLGRGTTDDQLLRTESELSAAGISVVRSDRGGGATYHGPGQIIGYPIVDLRRRGLGVRGYLGVLEGALAAAVREVGIDAWVRPGLTGVWSRRGKLAAIGITVRRGVTRHGFALNVSPDPDGFAAIVACGLDEPVTSMRALGWRGPQRDVLAALAGFLRATLDNSRSMTSRSMTVASTAAVRRGRSMNDASRAIGVPEGAEA